MGVSFNARGFRAALKDLRVEMASPGSETRSAMLKRAADVDAVQNAKTFSQERDPRTGRKWMTLDEENAHYAKWKRRNWPGRKMLVWTGRLRDSTRHGSAAGRIVRWKGQVIQLGTGDPLAVKHQEGESYSRPKMVFLRERRPYFPGGRRFVYRGGKRTKQPRKGRNWFTLWMKRLPARPFIGKNDEQAAELRAVVAAEIMRGWQRRLGGDRLRVRKARLARTAAAGRLRRR